MSIDRQRNTFAAKKNKSSNKNQTSPDATSPPEPHLLNQILSQSIFFLSSFFFSQTPSHPLHLSTLSPTHSSHSFHPHVPPNHASHPSILSCLPFTTALTTSPSPHSRRSNAMLPKKGTSSDVRHVRESSREVREGWRVSLCGEGEVREEEELEKGEEKRPREVATKAGDSRWVKKGKRSCEWVALGGNLGEGRGFCLGPLMRLVSEGVEGSVWASSPARRCAAVRTQGMPR